MLISPMVCSCNRTIKKVCEFHKSKRVESALLLWALSIGG